MAPPEIPAGARDLAQSLDELESRLDEAKGYLGIDAARLRRDELEAIAGEPGLWDDQDRARQVTTELGRVADDLSRFDALATSIDDARVDRRVIGCWRG